MTALEVFQQNDGEVTKAYYLGLAEIGAIGHIAVCLFRAQKRSAAAKGYRRGKFRRAAYDVKSWSVEQLCQALEAHAAALGIGWGWKQDPVMVESGGCTWVLYVDLPQGQVSFHSPNRGAGPDYAGDWDGQVGASAGRIIQFCDSVVKGVQVRR